MSICKRCAGIHKKKLKIHGICCICSCKYALKSDDLVLELMHAQLHEQKRSFEEMRKFFLAEFLVGPNLYYKYDIETREVPVPLSKEFEASLEGEKRGIVSFNDGKRAFFIFRKIKDCAENHGVGFCKDCFGRAFANKYFGYREPMYTEGRTYKCCICNSENTGSAIERNIKVYIQKDFMRIPFFKELKQYE